MVENALGRESPSSSGRRRTRLTDPKDIPMTIARNPRPSGAPQPAVRRALIVSGSVGAGHDGPARELADRLRTAGVTTDVRDFLDALPLRFARLLRRCHIGTASYVPAANQFLFDKVEQPGLFWHMEQALCASASPTVQRWLAQTRPDVVVSTYPRASQCLGRLRGQGRLSAPVFTYVTDAAVHRRWLHPAVDVHLTATEATAQQGGVDYGVPMVAAGPLVPARFAAAIPPGEAARVRAELRLPTGRPAALLVAGSLGVGDLLATVRDVAAAGVVPVALCGRNESLRRRVAAEPGARALGWRDDVHQLMHVCDVLVHNAGGLSLTEALVAGLPAVTYRPLPGHGRADAAVLDRSGVAPWAHAPAELAEILHRQIAAGRVRRTMPDPTTAVLGAFLQQPAA